MPELVVSHHIAIVFLKLLLHGLLLQFFLALFFFCSLTIVLLVYVPLEIVDILGKVSFNLGEGDRQRLQALCIVANAIEEAAGEGLELHLEAFEVVRVLHSLHE